MSETLAYLIVGAGGAVAVVRLVPLFFAGINVGKFDEVIARLLGEGDVERARKLCHAAHHAPYARVLDAMVAAAEQGPADGDALVRERVRHALDETRASELRRARRLDLLGWLAIAIAAVGVVVAATAEPVRVGPLALAAAPVLLVVHSWRTVTASDRAILARAPAHIEPLLSATRR